MKKKVLKYSLLAFVVAVLSLSGFVSYGECGRMDFAECYTYENGGYCRPYTDPGDIGNCDDGLSQDGRPIDLKPAP